MSQTLLQKRRAIAVLVNGLMVYTNGFSVSGSYVLKEQGTADGRNVVTAVYPEGVRLELKGHAAPDVTAEQLLLMLGSCTEHDVQQDLVVAGLRFAKARVQQYAVREKDGVVEYMMQFVSPDPPKAVEEAV